MARRFSYLTLGRPDHLALQTVSLKIFSTYSSGHQQKVPLRPRRSGFTMHKISSPESFFARSKATPAALVKCSWPSIPHRIFVIGSPPLRDRSRIGRDGHVSFVRRDWPSDFSIAGFRTTGVS